MPVTLQSDFDAAVVLGLVKKIRNGGCCDL